MKALRITPEPRGSVAPRYAWPVVSAKQAASRGKSRKKRSIETDNAIERYLEALEVERGLAVNTVEAYRRDLVRLADALADQKVELLSAQQGDLSAHLRRLRRDGLAPRSISRALVSARRFFVFLETEGTRSDNPALHLEPPKLMQKLPRVLREDEVESLLLAPDSSTAAGLRDKSMIELLYASGLRVSELVGLGLSQLQLDGGFLIAFGKGDKERVVPVGESAESWLRKWLDSGRAGTGQGAVMGACSSISGVAA